MPATHFSGPVIADGGFRGNNCPFWSPAPICFKTGMYSSPPVTSVSTRALTNGDARFLPAYHDRDLFFDRIAYEQTVAGTDASSVMRLGLYADNGACAPGSLILDAGTVPCGTGSGTGSKEIVINLRLPPGLYWWVGVAQAVAATGPTIRVVSSMGAPQNPTSVPANVLLYLNWQVTGLTGPLPAAITPAPTAQVIGAVRLYLRPIAA